MDVFAQDVTGRLLVLRRAKPGEALPPPDPHRDIYIKRKGRFLPLDRNIPGVWGQSPHATLDLRAQAAYPRALAKQGAS